MYKEYKVKTALLITMISSLLFIFNSCGNNDEGNSGQVQLNSFGPSFLMRGEQLQFIGNNLDKVTSIVLPDNVSVTSFVTKTPTLVVINVPNETVNGKVVLKTPQGDIETKTKLVISEPITITSISPATVRPGDMITISGTYLTLVSAITFNEKKLVTSFESQSETKIEVIVPEDARTGKVVLSDDQAIPNTIESAADLVVSLPNVTDISPLTIKAGNVLTLTGTNLDLTKSITFAGGASLTAFESQSETEIQVKLPSNAQDGKIVLRPASNVEVVTTSSITVVAPTITSITPNPAKTGGNIVIAGTDLDLVNKVVFGGDKTGSIQGGGTATQITVKVPADAVQGNVTVSTASNKSVVSSVVLSLVKPTITSFTPTTVQTVNNPSITITGSDLDIVSKIIFEGGWEANVSAATATQITIAVVPGSVTGKFTLVTTNGDEVVSSQDLTIVPDVPNITSIPANAFIGTMLAISGTNMQVDTDIIFPGGVTATVFGTKSSTLIEVMVPEGTTLGVGKIKFVTTKNEIYWSPDVTIKRLGVEPVQDPSLVFFDFNGTGSKDSWWGAVSLVNDANSVDGGYGRINASYNGWTDLFWRNGSNNFPGSTIGTNVADYVMKFDIKILAPITGGNLKFRLEGSEGDFWYMLGPAAPNGAVVPTTAGWTTMTVPISAFKDGWGWGSNSPTDLSKVTGSFGAAFDNGASTVNIMIDNVRFHKIN